MMTRSSHQRICRKAVQDLEATCDELRAGQGRLLRALDTLLAALDSARVTGYVNPGVLDAAYAAAGRKQPGK
jgi:hypothetical protein